MATNVTLINNSLVKEYLHNDANGQDVIVHSSLTHAGESDMIILLLVLRLQIVTITYAQFNTLAMPENARHQL